MKRNLFAEYMDSKKKMKKPVVDITGDQLDVRKPPNTMPKPSDGRYKPGVVQPRTAKGGDWGRLGEKDLVYKPKVTGKGECKPAKIPTAEQIKHANFMLTLIEHDPSMLEVLVREMKKSGLLGALVAEVFEHRETHAHLAEILTSESYGPKLMKSLTNAMNEEVAKPFADQLDGGDTEEGGEEDDDPFKDEEDDDDDDDEFGEDPDADPDDPEGIGNGDEEGQDDGLQVGMEQDPNAMMMGGDPSQMGGDPNAMMMGGDPNAMMGGQPPMPMPGQPPMPMGGQPPMPMPGQPPMPMPQGGPMQQFQRKLMRAYQRAMMRKQ